MIATWDEGEWTEDQPSEDGWYWWDSFERTNNDPHLVRLEFSGKQGWIFEFNGKPRRMPEDGYWLGPVNPPTGPVNFGTAGIEDEPE